MYSSRGIGRQPMGDRRSNDRERHVSNAYQSSPDINFRNESYQQKIDKAYNEYRKSPNIDNSYGSTSKDGYTPEQMSALKEEPSPSSHSYVPSPSISKPQLNYSQNNGSKYDTNRTPNSNPMSTPYSTPNINSNVSTYSTPYASNPESRYAPNYNKGFGGPPPMSREIYEREESEEEIARREREEMIWNQKLDRLFEGTNSIEDLITLKEQYTSKYQNLEQILAKSAQREGDILRNKRRNRDDFRDPAMLELRKMQNDIRGKLDEISKFRVEIDKRIRAYNKAIQESLTKEIEGAPPDTIQRPHNYEAQLIQNSLITTTAEDDEEDDEEDEYEYENSTKDYIDPSNHWCRDCDKISPKINDFFEHLHTKDHWETAANNLKPWKKTRRQLPQNPLQFRQTKIQTPIKGVQFLIALRGFYCPLCKDYLADTVMAEEHMKGAKHNRIYNRFICLNMDYESKWESDRQKALSRSHDNERKRKKEEEQKELEKKRKLQEQKAKEEKEIKKRKREEENKKKDKEDKEREREKEREEYRKHKSSNVSSSSDRFRLKSVTIDLKDDKSNSSHKEMGRDKDKHKKRSRIYTSSSDSDESPPRKKKQTYFGDPKKDPKLKISPSVKLIRLNKRTAEKYRCKQLFKIIEYSEYKKEKPIEKKEDLKTEIKIVNSPITMEIIDDINDDNDNKEIKSLVAGVLQNLDNESDNKEESTTISKLNEEKSDYKKDSEIRTEELENNNSLTKVTEKFDDKTEDKQNKSISDESFESDTKLIIDTDLQKEDKFNEFNDSKLCSETTEINSNDKRSE